MLLSKFQMTLGRGGGGGEEEVIGDNGLQQSRCIQPPIHNSRLLYVKNAVTWQGEAVCPWPCQYTMAVGRVDIVLFPECLYFWSSVRGQESVT
jgi:hypothetical protein